MNVHQIVPVTDEAMDQLRAMDAPAQSPISTTLAGVAPIQTWMELGQILPDIGDVDKKILASVGNTNTILVSTTTKDILATITVSIGTNGHWEVGGVDTGIPATGTSPERVPRPVGLYNAVVLGSANGALVLPAGVTYTVADGTDYYTLSTTSEIHIPVDESASIITIDRSGTLRVYPISTSLWTIPSSQAVLLVRTGLPASPVEQGWLMPTVHNAWVVAASTESFARLAQSAAITAQQAGELAATAVLQANAALAAAQVALNQANTLKVAIEQIKAQIDATAAQLTQMLTEATALNTQAIASAQSAAVSAATATTKAGEASASAQAAEASKVDARQAELGAEDWYNKVLAMAAPIAAMLYYAGTWDATTGVFPSIPPAGDARTPAYVCSVRGVIANYPYYQGDLISYNRSLSKWEVLTSEARDLMDSVGTLTMTYNPNGSLAGGTAATALGQYVVEFNYTNGVLTSAVTTFGGIRETITLSAGATFNITTVVTAV